MIRLMLAAWLIEKVALPLLLLLRAQPVENEKLLLPQKIHIKPKKKQKKKNKGKILLLLLGPGNENAIVVKFCEAFA